MKVSMRAPSAKHILRIRNGRLLVVETVLKLVCGVLEFGDQIVYVVFPISSIKSAAIESVRQQVAEAIVRVSSL